jgi:hypothetical protein
MPRASRPDRSTNVSGGPVPLVLCLALIGGAAAGDSRDPGVATVVGGLLVPLGISSRRVRLGKSASPSDAGAPAVEKLAPRSGDYVTGNGGRTGLAL